MSIRITPRGEGPASGSIQSVPKAESDISVNRAKFEKFNRIRFQNVYHVFPDNCGLIFKIAPFLLHVNFRGFPGFVDHPETPCGIKHYAPDEETVVLIDRYFSKKVKVSDKSDRSEGFIEFISVMGSVGSVAQTRNSDFDIWVGIHRDCVDDDSYRRFLQKLRDVEAWLMTMRLEVHFFATDVKSVRNNVFGSVDDESCGSAQALMLKDEYYRTAILIVGKVPFWWMVHPHATDEEYTAFYNDMARQNGVFSSQYIDIGNIGKIEKGEFFGAALWQLVKSLQRPFKSFLKMCLIEKYLYSDTADRVSLLSNSLKENVLRNGDFEPRDVDSYLLMFDSIDEFFLRIGKEREADLLRTCFYMKVQPNLSGLNKNARAGSQKLIVMDRYAKLWKWDQARVQRLDSFHNWPMDDILKLDRDLRVYMIETFSKLTKTRDLVENNNLISANDLTVITRKLMSYYLPKPKKVKHFCFSFDDTVNEPELNIARMDGGWRLHRGEVAREKHQLIFSNLLYSAPHLSELCLWTAHSGIFSPHHTKLSVYFSDAGISGGDVTKAITAMSDTVTSLSHARPKDYLQNPYIRGVFFTCLLDPADMADRICVIYVNSWGEVFMDHFSSVELMDPLICQMVSGYLQAGRPNPIQFLTFHSVTGGMKELLAFKGRMLDILSAFRQTDPNRVATVYVAGVEGNYTAFAAAGSDVRRFAAESFRSLLDAVRGGVKSDLPRRYSVDAQCDDSLFIAKASQLFKAGCVDVFVGRAAAEYAFILLSDELNRLTAEVLPAARAESQMTAVIERIAAASSGRKANFYELKSANDGANFRPFDPATFTGPVLSLSR